MNTIEVGLVVKLADELFYAIDSTRMASIEYGIVNSKGTHLSEVSINILDMCGIICVKNLKFEQLLMRCGHLVKLFFPT